MGAVLIEGKWQLTEESLQRAAERLTRHRTQCRERYRINRAALAMQRPDLFKYKQKPWVFELPRTLTQEADVGGTPST